MRRLYILEFLGLDDTATKFIVLTIVLLLVETIIARHWEQKNREAGKKAKSGLLLWIRIGTVAAVILGWYLTVRGIPLLKADRLLAEGKYMEAVAAYEDLNHLERREQALQKYLEAALEAGDVDLAVDIYERLGQRENARELLANSAEAEFREDDREAAVAEMCQLLSEPEVARKLLENKELYDSVFVPGREVALEWGETWFIAAVEENRILAVRRSADNSCFHKEALEILDWKDSVLRENLQFLRSFMQPLRESILVTRNKNLVNDNGIIVPGEDTEDYVFILTAEEMIQYLGPVAEHFSGEPFWTRTPVEGSTGEWYTAAMSLDEEGAVQLTLTAYDPTMRQPVLEAMWVDTDLLLQGWADF